ncbi:MAG TPA: hypothetical protein PLV15_06970, partial [Smithella sp.]|nr:hypothetical protein [Smithella sp.]
MFSILKKAALTIAVVALMSSVALAGSSIVIKGSTTVLPITQSTLEAFMKKHPDVQMSLSGGGSG